MSRVLLIFVLAIATGLVEAQTPGTAMPSPTPKAPVTPQPAGNPTPPVAPEAAVITIHGLCQPGADPSKPDACVTRVTKAQFEDMLRVINATGPMYSPLALKSLAQRYAEFLILSDAATKAGVDKDPRYLAAMNLARLRNLSDYYRRYLDEKSQQLSPEEIRAYYNQNLAKYQQLRISRIFLPGTNPKYMKQGREEYRKKVQKLAGELRQRALDGEEMDKLQKEAYSTLGLGLPPATSDLGLKRHGTLPPSVEKQADSLKAGDISPVLEEPAGFTIIKVVTKGPASLDAVRTEIVQELARVRLDAALKAALGTTKTDMNEDYFKTTGTRPPMIPGARPSRNAPPLAPGGVPTPAPAGPGSAQPTPKPSAPSSPPPQ